MTHRQPTPPEPLDELLALLTNCYCREVIAYFRNSAETTATVDDLVDEIDKQDHGGSKRVATQLHHVVLPKLAETNVIDYDRRGNVVEYHGHPELETLMDGIAE